MSRLQLHPPSTHTTTAGKRVTGNVHPSLSSAGSKASKASLTPSASSSATSSAASDPTPSTGKTLLPPADAAVAAQFPALERMLAVKSYNLRERRLYQLALDEQAKQMQQVQQQQTLSGQLQQVPQKSTLTSTPLHIQTNYPTAPPMPQAVYYPYAQVYPQPIPPIPAASDAIPSAAAFPAAAFPIQPQSFLQPPAQTLPTPTAIDPTPHHHTAAAPSRPTPSPSPSAPLDPEPLSPASLEDILLLPEVQSHLEQLKTQWMKEYDHKYRFHQPPPGSLHKSSSKQLQERIDVQTSTIHEGVEEEEADHSTHAFDKHKEKQEEQKHAHDVKLPTHTAVVSHSPLPSTDALVHDSQLSSELSDQLSTLQLRYDSLQHQHTSTNESLLDLERRHRELERKLEKGELDRTKEKQDLSSQLSLANAHINQLESVQLVALQGEVETLRTREKELETRVEKQDRAINDANVTTLRCQNLIEKQERELSTIKHESQEKSITITALQESKSILESELKELLSDLKQVKKQLEDSRSAVREKEKEYDGKIKEQSREFQEQIQLQKAQQDKQNLLAEHEKTEKKELESELAELKKDLERAQKEEENSKKTQLAFIEQLHGNIDTLQSEYEKSSLENRSLRTELQTIITAFEEARKKHQKKLATLQEAFSEKCAENEDCKILLKTMMGEEKNIRTSRNEVVKNLNATKDELAAVKQELFSLKQKEFDKQLDAQSKAHITGLEQELRVAKEISSRLEQEKEKISVELEELQQRNKYNASQWEKEKHELLTTRSNASVVDPHDFEQLQQSLHETRDKLAIKDKILESLTEQLSNERGNLATLQAENRTLSKSLSDSEKNLQEHEDLKKNYQKDLQMLSHRTANEWMDLERELEEFKNELVAKDEEADKLTKLLTKKQDSLNYIETEILEMKSLFSRKEMDTLAKFNVEREEKKQELIQLQKEYNELYQELQVNSKQLQDAQNQVHQTEQEMRILITEVERERKMRKQMKQHLQNLLPEF